MIELLELHKQKTEIHKKINKRKKFLNKNLRKKHKTIFKLCDIAIITIFLLDISCLMITNTLAVKDKPEVKIMELNPIPAKTHNYKLHPEYKIKLTKVLYHPFMFAGILLLYLYFRYNILTKEDLWYFIFGILLIFLIAFYGIANDFGLLLGRLL